MNRLAPTDTPATVENPSRANWVGVFTKEPDLSRYRTIIKIADCQIQVVREQSELQMHKLIGCVFDEGLRGWKRDVLVTMVAQHIPVVVGPGAKSAQRWAWELKPGIEAAGGIFEIATDESDFPLRLGSVFRAATIRLFEARSFTLAGAEPSSPTPYLWGRSQIQRELLLMQAALKALQERNTETTVGNSLAALPGVRSATQDLRDHATGRLDGELIRSLFGLNRRELAKIAGVSAEALRQTPHSPNHQPLFGEFERIAALRTVLANPTDFAKWLESPNSELEENRPNDLIRDGRVAVVANLVQDILTNRSG